MPKVVVDPVTRIEGHLKIELEVEREPKLNNEYFVKTAHCSATMFRGLEIILKGRDPPDAFIITQRACGVCPIAHANASIYSLDHAYNVVPPPGATIVRNIIQASNTVMSHILHFYLLAGPEYGIVAKHPPMIPPVLGKKGILEMGLGASYAQALHYRRRAQELLVLWGGRMPHIQTYVPGGVTVQITEDKVAQSLAIAIEILEWVARVMIPDALKLVEADDVIREVTGDILGANVGLSDMGVGYGNFLSYGVYPKPGTEPWSENPNDRYMRNGAWSGGSYKKFDSMKIAEYVKHSWYDEAWDGKHPWDEDTKDYPRKPGAYSWAKSPRYDRKPYEVGPLARMVNHFGMRWSFKVTHPITGDDLSPPPYTVRNPNGSMLDRMVARAYETLFVADLLVKFILDAANYIGKPVSKKVSTPARARGKGLNEAPRGAVGHWINIENYRIKTYQIITPTAWNVSPRDTMGQPGPIEQSLHCGTTWIPTLDVPTLMGAVYGEDYGNLLRQGLSLHGLADINMEKVGGESFNVTIPLMITRSFDPCLACTVHFSTPKGSFKKDLKPLR